MHFTLDSSLAERSAIVVTAYALYHKHFESHDEIDFFLVCSLWERTVTEVTKELGTLRLPECANQHILNLIQPMAHQIQKWLEYHDMFIINPANLPKLFCWNPHGVIDRKKTAEKIIASKIIGPLNCFRIACMYCIDTHIHELWPKVSSHYYKKFHQGLRLFESIEVMFWVCHLQQILYVLMETTEHICDDDFEYGLALAIDFDRDVAAEYFLQKIESNKRPKIIHTQLKWKLREETMTFTTRLSTLLLRYLPEEEHDAMLQNHTLSFLMRFIKWPEHRHFIKATDKMWGHIDDRQFYLALDLIAHQHSKFWMGDVYSEIYKQFWIRSPAESKDYVIDKCIKGPALSNMCTNKLPDDVLKVVLDSATPAQKQTMFFTDKFLQALDYLVIKQRFTTVLLFIQECVPPQNKKNDLDWLRKEYWREVLTSSNNKSKDKNREYFLYVLFCLKTEDIIKTRTKFSHLYIMLNQLQMLVPKAGLPIPEHFEPTPQSFLVNERSRHWLNKLYHH